jgi:hypothetical protein
MPNQFISGRGYAPDNRDFQLKRGKSTRRFRYWADGQWFGDQQETPHCVGFGWSHWLHCAPIVNWLDPDGIYHYAKFVDEWKGEAYDGTSVRAGAKVLHHLGLIESYAFATDLPTTIYTLLEKGPVVIGVNWYEGMFQTDAEGLIHATGSDLGGHCVVLTGINLDRGLVRGKQSWGLDWGINGRFWLPLDDLNKLMRAQGEICLAVERKGVPR